MPRRELRISMPTIPPGLGANLLGLLGLIGVAVAVGALAGNWWWSVLIGSLAAVALSWLAGATNEVAAKPATAIRPVPAAGKSA